MRFHRTDRFKNLWKKLPNRIQRRAERCLILFAQNPRHSSLRIRRMAGKEIWEMSITMNYRITFEYEDGDRIRLRKIGTHDILRNP